MVPAKTSGYSLQLLKIVFHGPGWTVERPYFKLFVNLKCASFRSTTKGKIRNSQSEKNKIPEVDGRTIEVS